MRLPKPMAYSVLSATLALAALGSGCQPAANTNVNLSTNANVAPATNTNTATTATGATIEAREPERYRATMVLTAQTSGGERAAAIPQLTAEVARDGANRRLEFRLPSAQQVVFLSRGAEQYIILPGSRQYFAATPETAGMNAGVMTPGQIVEYARNQRGVERVGETEMNGRPVVQYRYASAAQTGTQAGEVRSETFIYVDRETGLPIRTELRAQSSGQVQGANAINAVIEMRDIRTDVEATAFELPQGYSQITAEQVRQQVNAVMSVLTQIAGAMMSQQAGTTTPPATTTSPGATATTPATGATPRATP